MAKRIVKLIGNSGLETEEDREKALRVDLDYYLGELSVAKQDGDEYGEHEAMRRLREIHDELKVMEGAKNA